MKRNLMLVMAILCLTALNSFAVETVQIYWTGLADNGKLVDPGNWDVDPNDSADYKIYANVALVAGQTDFVVEAGDTTKNLYGWRFPGEDALANQPDNTPVSLTITGGKMRTWDSTYAGDAAKGYIGIAHLADTEASFTMTGGQVEAGSFLWPRQGHATVNITGGDITLTNYIRMGEVAGHGGSTVNFSGGTITIYDPASSDRYMGIGYQTGGLTTFNMSGTAEFNASRIACAQYGDAELNITSGTMDLYNGLRMSTNGGDGTFNMQGGTVNIQHISTNEGLNVGYSGDGFSQLNMSGGTINTTILRIARNADGRIDLSGGTINVNYLETYTPGLVFDDNGSGGLGAGVGELNLCGGTLVWHQYEPGVYPATTDPGKTFEEYIADGKIFAHDKAGRVVVDGDTIYADDTAYAPIPGLDEQLVNPAITSVSWTSPFAGQSVVCDVWFGTDQTMATAAKVVDGLAVTSAPVTLAATTTYYWRVDTYDPVTSAKTEGVVWSFTTNAMGAQDAVAPVDGGTGVLKSQILEWTFFGSYDTVNINIGETQGTMVQVGSQSSADTDFFYDSLEYCKMYYWRVDAVTGANVTPGPVWSFSTAVPQCQIGAVDGDLNGDCHVTLADFALMVQNWMDCGWDIAEACN